MKLDWKIQVIILVVACFCAFIAGRYIQVKNPSAVTEISSASNASAEKENVEKCNINTATREELLSVPGMDDWLCENILLYREGGGEFSNLGQLENYVSADMIQKLTPYLSVE